MDEAGSAESTASTNSGDAPNPLLTGSMRRTVLILSLPVLLEQVLNFLVGFVDTWLSGRISATATAAIGTGAYINWLVELLLSLIGTGATALVARHWGAGQFSEARRVTTCALSLAIAAGVLVSVLMYLAAPVFTDFLKMHAEAGLMATDYLRVCAFGHVLTSVCLIGGAAFRGAGNMVAPMAVLGLVSVLNVVFSRTLVVNYHLGVTGIALGTMAARAVGAALMIGLLSSRHVRLNGSVALSGFRDRESLARILKIGLPALGDGLLIWTGHFLFLRLISSLDSETILAAHMVGIQIEALNYMPAWAWGMAAATMIGQCLGAEMPDRARQAGREATLQAVLFAAVVTIFFMCCAEAAFEFMHRDERVGAIGIPALRILAISEIPLSIAIVLTIGIRGAGDTLPAMLVNSIGIICVRLPLSYWLAISMGLGLNGAWLGLVIDVIARSVAISLYFHYGPWCRKLEQRHR